MDNPGEIIEAVYRRSYLPFVENLADHPSVKVNFHYSGYLLDWLQEEHPEFISLLRSMVSRGQVEVVGGGYYEPILPVIPDRDAEGQLRELRSRARSLLGFEPAGVWVAERAWEPQLPELLSRSGARYALVDDTAFYLSGISSADCHEPYVVESRGYSISVFPMLKSLRYRIPWRSTASVFSHLRGMPRGLAVFGDDGEKFGAWPTTYETVYTKGWLREFLDRLSGDEGLTTVRLSEYLLAHPPGRRTYLPTASYDELMDWSLPVSHAKGARGFWRLFLSKYGESARLYSRMLSVSRSVARSRGPDARRARVELWKGQCNDAYWHGVFGGLYSPTLRRIAYHHLIEAGRLSSGMRARNAPRVERTYFDGRPELTVETRALWAGFSSAEGGALYELDHLGRALNLTDVLRRRREAYHSKVGREGRSRQKKKLHSIHDPPHDREADLRAMLVYDRYPRFSFLDHLLSPETSVEEFIGQEYREVAPLAGTAYGSSVKRREGDLELVFEKQVRGARSPLRKRFSFDEGSPRVDVRYTLEGSDARFGFEVNLGSLGDPEFARRYLPEERTPAASSVRLDYPSFGFGVVLSFDRRAEVWRVPVRTVSQSEAGFESNLQGVTVMPTFEPGDLDVSARLELLAL